MLRRTISTSEALCSKCRLHNYKWFGGMMLCCRSTSEIQRRDAPLLDCKVGGTMLQVPITIYLHTPRKSAIEWNHRLLLMPNSSNPVKQKTVKDIYEITKQKKDVCT